VADARVDKEEEFEEYGKDNADYEPLSQAVRFTSLEVSERRMA
jgi:hypothetical protein